MLKRTLAVLALLALSLTLAACATSAPPAASATRPGAAQPTENRLDAVLIRTFTTSGFALDSGQVLPEMNLVYETYGRLAPDGRNAVLITHAATSSQHATGRYAPTDRAPGWWDGLIGPGKAIDTDRYFVVSSNMLGSSYGSTGPRSINPATGKPYGPDFPAITVRDMVRAQRLLLVALGVKHLVLVAGPSYGGFLAFQWAVTYPDFMDGIAAVTTAPRMPADLEPAPVLLKQLAADPNWNNGWYYERGGIPGTLAAVRYATLIRYGADELLEPVIPHPARRAARLHQMSAIWAKEFDPNSLIALRNAVGKYDTTADFRKIRAKVLYVLSRTDKLFPPSIAPAVMDALARASVDATYHEINSDYGHLASGPDWPQWAPTLERFLLTLRR